jgi:hypothetical protein
MKILTTTIDNNETSISFNCDAISRIQEPAVHKDKCIIYTHNEVYGIMVDTSYLEVLGFLKSNA